MQHCQYFGNEILPPEFRICNPVLITHKSVTLPSRQANADLYPVEGILQINRQAGADLQSAPIEFRICNPV